MSVGEDRFREERHSRTQVPHVFLRSGAAKVVHLDTAKKKTNEWKNRRKKRRERTRKSRRRAERSGRADTITREEEPHSHTFSRSILALRNPSSGLLSTDGINTSDDKH
jgi:hypothetical protein